MFYKSNYKSPFIFQKFYSISKNIYIHSLQYITANINRIIINEKFCQRAETY